MIRILLLEDNIEYLQAISLLIGMHEDLQIVYRARQVDDLNVLTDARPDVAILDIDLPGIDGIRCAAHISHTMPDTGILMLTVFEDDDKIFRSILAGAHGYLLKKDDPDRIIEAIRGIHAGESIINGRIARRVLEYVGRKDVLMKSEMERFNLTAREREILERIIEGIPHKIIADRCGISLHTLFTHTKNIYRKLNMHSRAEIAHYFGKR
jgi:DNA-binding NarL/FixJ family response regulator